MFQSLGAGPSGNGRAGLTVAAGRAALACVSKADGKRPALHAAVFALQGNGDGEPTLDHLKLDGANLARLRLSTVLPGGSYQLLLEELPNVPRDELRKAVGWRIRDRIDTPLDEAVIELLDMPEQARAGSKPSAYAAVTRRQVVETLVEQVRHAGLKLDAIDLPELCLRNIAVQLPQDEAGVAFLHFTDDCGLLTITRGGVLYLVRRIDVGRLALDGSGGTEIRTSVAPSVCLELQRSLDYYETHYDGRPITELVVGPGGDVSVLLDAVREQLGLNVSVLDLDDLFDLGETLSEEVQSECLLAVGAALREQAGRARGA